MDTLTMFEPERVAPDTEVLTAYCPVPGLGVLPMNAFLLRGREPVLIDAGVVALGDAFFDRIGASIALEDLRYVVLTHADPDHVGCLGRLLEAAPNAQLATTFLAMGKLGLAGHAIAPERVCVIEPGAILEAGERRLVVLAPPVFDAPESTAIFDAKDRFLYSADAFGAILSAPATTASDVAPGSLEEGIVTWTHVDAPWLGNTREEPFRASLDLIRRLAPRAILGSHLPPAFDMTERLLGHLERARTAAPSAAVDHDSLVARLVAA
jgi:glyoxylase-like metal-dependent hydrolase (beta-lactamase superfamily II)